MSKTFNRRLRSLSLTTKVVFITAFVGLASWLLADQYQSSTLRDVFRDNMIDHMEAEAFGSRILIHREFNTFFKSGSLIVSNVKFSKYIDSVEDEWASDSTGGIKIYKQQPPWYPEFSLKVFSPHIGLALLIDSDDIVREIYMNEYSEYPDFLRNPKKAIPQLIWGSSFLTMVDDKPYAITSDTLNDDSGNVRAILFLVLPIDDKFMLISKMPDFHDPVALIDEISSAVLASSNHRLIPPGTKLNSLEDRYLVIGEPFFDYGNSDLLIRVAVFTTKENIQELTEAFISRERFKRAASIFVIISIFSAITVQISRRISKVTRRIEDFSNLAFDGEPRKSPQGDELELLEKRFLNLTEAVVDRTAELVEEEHSHRTLAENLPGIVYRLFLGDDGRVQFFNEMLEPLTGYTIEELQFDGKCCMGQLIFMDDYYAVVDKVQKSVSANQPFKMEYRIKCKDGSIKHCIERGVPVQSGEGRVLHIDGIILDITDRKRAAEALMLAQFTLDSAADPVFWITSDARIIYVNDAACKSSGYSREELLSMTADDMGSSYSTDRWAEQWNSVIKKGHVVFETEHRTRDGRVFPVEVSASYIRHVDGEYQCMFARDISDRRRAETELRDGKQFLSNILESIQDGLCIIGADRAVVMANRTMDRWFGHQGQLVGRKCFEVICGRGEEHAFCPAKETLTTGQSSFETLVFKRPGGTKGWLDIYSFPLRAAKTGEVTGIIHYMRDVTDKIALQSEAARTAQLASLGELAAGVAHEINNPINGIINYAQILSNKLSNDKEGDIARRIIKEGDRVSGIVRSLLSFSRDEGSWKTTISVGDMLTEVISLIGSQLRKEGIRLVSDVKSDLPQINGNRQQIEQVFLNIINNARYALRQKYPVADENSVIEIWAEEVSFSGEYYVRVTFRDMGVGIPKDLLSKVASPFFTTKPRSSGTGLGLSISQNIINNHGGRLSISSVEGEYTQVAIDLPQRRGA